MVSSPTPIPTPGPDRTVKTNLLFKPINTPGDDNWCYAGFPRLNVRPFSVAALADPVAGGDCYKYVGVHLAYTPFSLEESPCGADSQDGPFRFTYYGKYGTVGAPGVFTYVALQHNVVTDIKSGLRDAKCDAFDSVRGIQPL